MLKTTPEMRKKDLVIQELENEILIYDLKADKVFGLNETSALIWQLSDGRKTMAEIAVDASQKLNSPISEEFVWLALWQLKKVNLIENGNQIESGFRGKTRREVIKKIGFTTLVTLPMVMSLIAPSSIQAQSGGDCNALTTRPLGCPCTNSTMCASSCCGLSGGTQVCVPMGLNLPPGTPCAFSCECLSTANCGLGPVCVDNFSVAPGQPCRGPISCVSNFCNCANPACSFTVCV